MSILLRACLCGQSAHMREETSPASINYGHHWAECGRRSQTAMTPGWAIALWNRAAVAVAADPQGERFADAFREPVP